MNDTELPKGLQLIPLDVLADFGENAIPFESLRYLSEGWGYSSYSPTGIIDFVVTEGLNYEKCYAAKPHKSLEVKEGAGEGYRFLFKGEKTLPTDEFYGYCYGSDDKRMWRVLGQLAQGRLGNIHVPMRRKLTVAAEEEVIRLQGQVKKLQEELDETRAKLDNLGDILKAALKKHNLV